MPFDPNGLIESISNGLPRVPSALIAAALLGGPTAIWLIVRFTRPRDVPTKVVEVPETLLWLCTSCRSMNEDRVDRCYRCHLPREADDIPVVVHVGREAASRIGIPVGPAAASRGHGYGWLGGEFVVPTPDTTEPVAAEGVTAPADFVAVEAPTAPPNPPPNPPPTEKPIAPADFVAVVDSPAEKTIAPPIVAPIAPADFVAVVEPPIATPIEPVILEPKVKVSGRKSASGPVRPRARRKPQGAGEANSKRNSRSPGS